MESKYPTDSGWWNATLYRLSGYENVPIRQLIAGNPQLPPAAFEALFQDESWEVLYELARNPAAPLEVVLKVLRDPDTPDCADEDFFEYVSLLPQLTAQDLVFVLEANFEQAQIYAVQHPSATEKTVSAFINNFVGEIDGMHIQAIAERFPFVEYLDMWNRLSGDLTYALLDYDETPPELLMELADKQYWHTLVGSGEDYSHETVERIFEHPNVTSDIFDLLMGLENFKNAEWNEDYPCLKLVYSSAAATPEQREAAGQRLSDEEKAELRTVRR